jgi:hypothetical protein
LLPRCPRINAHRAEVTKLLVAKSARGQGVGTALMRHAEEVSRVAGKTLLVLDTATGSDAERLYQRMGWTRVGVIRNYSFLPNGVFCGTTIFWKELFKPLAVDPDCRANHAFAERALNCDVFRGRRSARPCTYKIVSSGSAIRNVTGLRTERSPRFKSTRRLRVTRSERARGARPRLGAFRHMTRNLVQPDLRLGQIREWV